VRRGRREEFAALAFEWQTEIPDPQAPATFQAGKLSWQWPEGTPQAGIRRLYSTLLAARSQWPPLCDRKNTVARLVPAGSPGNPNSREALLTLQRGGNRGLLAIANLSGRCQPAPQIDLGQRMLILTTEEGRFGGSRESLQTPEPMLPYELQVFGNSEWRK
jgi:maltooligosyltrehalose trehalohydrolase